MYDSFHYEQYDILYKLDKWNTFRTNQNIFIEYRSWSGLFQTLSMYINQSNLSLKEVLFLTPIQVYAVEMTRDGLWAESIEEYIYHSYTANHEFDELLGNTKDRNNIHSIRDYILYRHENQSKPKLVIILNAEQISPKILKDCNKYLKLQTIVCYDSALYHPSDSLVYHVKKPIAHTFLNADINDVQKYLYTCLEMKMIPMSQFPTVHVHEYRRNGFDLSKLSKPIFTTSKAQTYAIADSKIKKGDIIYTRNYNWNHSLEDDRYYLIKGIYLQVDRIIQNPLRISAHPTYTRYKFIGVENLDVQKIMCPMYIENLTPWKFSRGSILVDKMIETIDDARRFYNAVNMFDEHLQVYIV